MRSIPSGRPIVSLRGGRLSPDMGKPSPDTGIPPYGGRACCLDSRPFGARPPPHLFCPGFDQTGGELKGGGHNRGTSGEVAARWRDWRGGSNRSIFRRHRPAASPNRQPASLGLLIRHQLAAISQRLVRKERKLGCWPDQCSGVRRPVFLTALQVLHLKRGELQIVALALAELWWLV